MTDPVAALREIARLLERAGGQTRRAQAFRRAAGALAGLPPDQRARHDRERSWGELPGIGKTTAAVIAQASVGREPDYLVSLRGSAGPLVAGPNPLRTALRGDLHLHTDWSDGCCALEEMVLQASAVGHDYCAVTDHSPSLRVARGLTADRLWAQVALVRDVDDALDGFRVLTGIEVDILPDGSLDQDPELLERLDVVVASVHSGLRMDADAMTRRMVTAIANPHTHVLGHCTGRLVGGDRGTRPASRFDAEIVFEACRQFGVAVEINCRPERQDPPDDLLALAVQMGCLLSIDTDAHAPGQLDFVEYGAARAASAGVPADRIITTWPVERLLAWLSPKARA